MVSVRRWAAVAALLLLLAVTIAAGMGSVLRSQPELALRAAPWDARAAGRLSQRRLVADPGRHGRAEQLARQALARDPTVVPAVVTLGAVADAERNKAVTLQRFNYAARLSRRDLPTQLWWIEHSVAEGDVGDALRHYDTALRTSSQAPDLLFPILGSAIADAAIRAPLIALFKADTLWRDRFLEWLVTNGVNDRPSAIILAQLRAVRRPIDPALFGRLERRLIDQGDYEAAWNSYRQRHPGARRDMAQDQGFAATAFGQQSPFDWNISADDGAASIGRLNRHYAVSFSTIPTQASILVRQFLLLPPGNYRLRTDAGLESGSIESAPYWSLRCVNEIEVGRTSLVAASATLKVPANCPAQWLTLRSDANDQSESASGFVRAIRLSREK